MGDTSKGKKANGFSKFAPTGATAIFTGYTTEFVGRAWDLEEDKSLVRKMALNCSEAPWMSMSRMAVEQVGVGADLVRN
ncbi:hypothetical protein MKW98_009260 [Papaver atlanticum]|uniref:Uncharacterized protein n=1 Tax=Papaver atlanticum TaxID=357466 RepID=A0AAD4T0T5_9MAGN|nr:hypothetical protein MKW98_009260 [Papaver atlanticum]